MHVNNIIRLPISTISYQTQATVTEILTALQVLNATTYVGNWKLCQDVWEVLSSTGTQTFVFSTRLAQGTTHLDPSKIMATLLIRTSSRSNCVKVRPWIASALRVYVYMYFNDVSYSFLMNATLSGDCDYDSDCAEGLKCFQRQTGYTETPGCIGGETFSHVTDFCILDTEGSGYKSNIPTATYIGCYVDSSSNRVFSPDTFFSHDEPGFYWSRETCFAHCVSNEFKYAGITDGSRTFCMCGNDPPSTQKASDSDCPACIVEGEGNCGEAWRVAVYQFADETSPLSNQNGDGSCDSIQFFRFGDPIIDPNNRCENGQIEWALEDPYDIYGGNGETCDAWNICHWGMKCVLGECTDGGVGSFCLGNGHCHQKRLYNHAFIIKCLNIISPIPFSHNSFFGFLSIFLSHSKMRGNRSGNRRTM